MVTLRWRRSKTKDHRHLGNAPPETDTTTHAAAHTITYIATHTTRRPSRPFPLPYDIVEMIVANLTHDFLTLEACSLISRSWYTAAVTHLHHTLTLTGDAPETHSQLKPLFTLRELGLAPLVKTIRVCQQSYGPTWFTPRGFDSHAFSGFTNVQTLRLGELDIYLFIPGNERSFEHFFPTLRSIALHNPCCTPRQLSHFLSPFSNLDDIEIQKYTCVYNSTTPDTVPVPFSAPKLRGRLLLHDFPRVETWTDLIVSWDGLRFRYMDLCRSTSCAPVLLDACANTLDTLRFSATDGSVGERFHMVYIRTWTNDGQMPIRCHSLNSIYRGSKPSDLWKSRICWPVTSR